VTRRVRSFLLVAALLSAVVGCANDGTLPEVATVPVKQSPLKPTVEATPTPSLGDARTRSIDGMPMVFVPTGEFQMGSDEGEVDYALELCKQYDTNCRRNYFSVEQPPHTVVLDAFWIDKTEVTNSQYAACQAAGACDELDCQVEAQEKSSERPVVCVIWDQAAAYCAWAGARLPTEAEWEYAARGAEGRRYPWGDEFDGTLLNYCDANCTLRKRDEAFDDGYARTAPVGSYPAGASWVGALDMAGNVWELVADWNAPYSPERQVNPAGPDSGQRRVARGGSWHTSPDHARSALRTHVGPDQSVDHAGFRCVQAVP
jgi:formylglycine-generating enzyme required for sulfatase activity